MTVQPSIVAITEVERPGPATFFSTEFFPALISEGSGSLLLTACGAGNALEFSFDAPVTAFGVNFLDPAPPFDLLLTVNGVSETYVSGVAQTMVANGPLFLGVIDPDMPFSLVSITTETNLAATNSDFVQFGSATAVPLPAGAPLLLSGLAFMALGFRSAASSADLKSTAKRRLVGRRSWLRRSHDWVHVFAAQHGA